MSSFTARLGQLRNLLGDGVDDLEVLDVVGTALGRIDSTVGLAEDGNLDDEHTEALRRAVDAELERARGLSGEPTPTQVLEWVRGALTAVDVVLVDVLNYPDAPMYVRDYRAQLRESLQDVTARLDREAFLSRAEMAVAEAEGAATKARDAAGLSGGASLAEFFAEYAGEELKAALRFRWLTIGSIALASLLAVSLPRPGVDDWAGLVYRLAFLAGVGALAAYFARQAGQHRRVYNWAKGLEVQLKSFPAFIESVEEGTRAEIYRLFASRLLGAMPERGSGSADDGLSAGQAVELLTALARRGAPQAP
ncbi:hypothetical protein [Microbacterium sp. NPDC096154]|uniref:hypothetical protein n=1 Tax=Microbacterium sp. NPDC096154 TaxID=3155549 RepID=UPI00332AAB08